MPAGGQALLAPGGGRRDRPDISQMHTSGCHCTGAPLRALGHQDAVSVPELPGPLSPHGEQVGFEGQADGVNTEAGEVEVDDHVFVL